MSAPEPPDVWLPTTGQIVMASERAILAALDTALLLAARTLQAEHAGPHDAMQDAWRAVREACAALGYVQSGPMTEVYVKGGGSGATPAEYITLVRLPYAR